jgi:hypothetical protein
MRKPFEKGRAWPALHQSKSTREVKRVPERARGSLGQTPRQHKYLISLVSALGLEPMTP